MSTRRCCLFAALWLLVPLSARSALNVVQVVHDSASGLTGSSAIAVSPDGQNAYVTSSSGNSVAMFVRDLSPDQYRYIGKLVDGVDGVSGLQGASAVAVSPDGHTVYVTGKTANALAVFDRTVQSGLLYFDGAFREGEDVAFGLAAPTGVAVAPNGRVFVSSSGDDGLSAFDPGFPLLTQVGVWRNGDTDPVGGFLISGLTGASGVVATTGYSGGNDVYVSSPTDSAVAVFSNDSDFPFNRFHEMQVVQDGVGGFDGLAQAAGLALSPDGHELYVAGAGDSAVAVLDRNPTSSLLSFNSLAQDGVGGVTGLGAVFGVCAEPSGHSVYAGGGEGSGFPHPGFDPAVVALGVNLFDYSLGFVQASGLPGYLGFGSALVSLASLPDSSRILAAEALTSKFEATGQLWIYARDSGTGALTALQTLPEAEGIRGLRGAQSVVASPDGKDVYVLGSDEYVTSSFHSDPWTGVLSFFDASPASGTDAFQIAAPYRSAAMSPDGQNLYETAFRHDSLTVFQRDASSGVLSPSQQFLYTDVAAGLIRPTAVAVAPDGLDVYVVGGNGPDDSAITLFRRTVGGALTYAGADLNGPGGLNGFIAPQSIVVSPDGKNVYVGLQAATNALAQFTRNPATGELGFIAFYSDPTQVSFAFAFSLAMSGDGRFLYVGSSNRVATLERNTTSGNLTPIDALPPTGATANGYLRIALTPDGRQLYAAIPGYPHASLARFSRNPATGLLTVREALNDSMPGDESLAGAVSAASSPNSRYVYVAGYVAHAVTVFAPEPGAALLGAVALGALTALRRRRS
jgi:MYXO-CTERM domain-containing protein